MIDVVFSLYVVCMNKMSVDLIIVINSTKRVEITEN